MPIHGRAGLLVLVALAGFDVGSAAAQGPPATPPPPTGIVAGVVRDEAGAPVPDARVLIEGFPRLAITGAAGRFMLEQVRAGEQVLVVRKIGYREARAAIPVPVDSAISVEITLVAAPQQLPGVVVQAQLLNQIGGVVIDEQDKPIPDVVIDVVGLNRRFTTQEDGRFLLLDLDPGHYLLQFRKSGYAVAQYGLQMAREIERDFSVRLRRRTDERLSAELAAVVALESNRRQSMAGARAAVISRDELARFGDAPLAAALLESPAAIAYRETGSSCVLINGHEMTTVQTAADRTTSRGGARGPGSIMNGGGGNTRVGGSRSPPGGASSAFTGLRGGWLDFFRANEVEMVEIYPEGTENSRTLCGRFPPSSGCSCPPDPAGLVIWLRQ